MSYEGNTMICYPPDLDGFIEYHPLCATCHNCKWITPITDAEYVVKCNIMDDYILYKRKKCGSFKKRDWFGFNESRFRMYRYHKVARATWTDKTKYLYLSCEPGESDIEYIYVSAGGVCSRWEENSDDIDATDWYVV